LAGRPADAVAVLRQTRERQAAFPAHSEDARVAETRLKTALLLARGLAGSGHPYLAELQEAHRQQALLAAFGSEYAVKAREIERSLWIKRGDGK
jgi:hypothetical protein